MSERIVTVDEVKNRVDEVKALARAEMREAVRADPVRLAVAGVVAVILMVSVAYHVGRQRCARGDVFD